MIYSYLFTLLAGIFDTIFTLLFKADYAFMFFNAFLDALVIAVVLCSIEYNYKEAILFTFVVGFGASFFYPNNNWLLVISLILTMLISKRIATNFTNSLLEEVLICLLAVFIKEFVTYLFYYVNHTTALSLINWLKKDLLLTIFINIPVSIVFVLLNRHRLNIIDSINDKKKKNERVFNR